MRIATWNVNSLKARLEKVTWWLERAKPDVLMMQETKLTDADAPVATVVELRAEPPVTGRPAASPRRRVARRTAKPASPTATAQAIMPPVERTVAEPARASVTSNRPLQGPAHGTDVSWMLLLTGAFGLAAAGELSRACRPGRQDWNALRRVGSIVVVAAIFEAVVIRIL